MALKSYLSCLDDLSGLVDVLTAPIMHLVISNFAESIGGAIVFYTAEDPMTKRSQAQLRAILAKERTVDGIIFFRLKQFAYGDKFNFSLLSEMIEKGYEAHFAREGVSLRNKADLDAAFPELYCYESSLAREPECLL